MSNTKRALLALLITTFSASLIGMTPAPAPAQEHPVTEHWIQDAQIVWINHNTWNDVEVRVGANITCPGTPAWSTDRVHIIDNYSGEAKEGLLRTLLSAHLAGRRVDLAVAGYTLGSTDFCAIKRVRIR